MLSIYLRHAARGARPARDARLIAGSSCNGEYGVVDLPVMPPVAPMLAKAVSAVPEQPDGEPSWSYEPKWDGFRALVFRDGDEVYIGSVSYTHLTLPTIYSV